MTSLKTSCDRWMKRQHNASHLRSGIHTTRIVRCMDCCGKQSTPPLSSAQAGWNVSTRFIRTKAVSPLRSATAVHSHLSHPLHDFDISVFGEIMRGNFIRLTKPPPAPILLVIFTRFVANLQTLESQLPRRTILTRQQLARFFVANNLFLLRVPLDLPPCDHRDKS